MRSRLVPLSALALLALGAPAVQAGTVYDSGYTYADASNASDVNGSQLAAAFSLGSASTVSSVEVLLYTYASIPATSVAVGIYADEAGIPSSSAIAYETVSVGVDDWVDTGADEYGYDFVTMTADISNVALADGDYWLSIEILSPDSSFYWAFYEQYAYGTQYVMTDDGWQMERLYADAIFSLSDDVGETPAVPLPAALPLLAAGLAGLALVGRRRARG